MGWPGLTQSKRSKSPLRNLWNQFLHVLHVLRLNKSFQSPQLCSVTDGPRRMPLYSVMIFEVMFARPSPIIGALRGSSSVSGQKNRIFKQRRKNGFIWLLWRRGRCTVWSRQSRLMVRPFFYYELYTITFKRVFLETRFFQTAAIMSQKLVNWFCSNLHSIFSTYIATSWTKILKIASLVFFYQLNRPQKSAKNGIFF